jgi:glycosyltransferase involved in cell wall biosynthesis
MTDAGSQAAGCDITVFVSSYNEEETLPRTLETLREAMAGVPLRYEVLICDDASTDRSVEVAREFITRHGLADRYRILVNPTNRGIGRNYFTVAEQASGKYFFPLHGDDPLPVNELRQLLALVGQADVIIPYWDTRLVNMKYNHDHRPLSRRLLSCTYAQVVRLLSGLNIRYFNGLVVHRRDIVLANRVPATGLGYQAELLCRVLQDPKVSFLEVRLHNYERRTGASNAFKPKAVASTLGSLGRILRNRLSA